MEVKKQQQLLFRSKSTGFLDKIDNELDFKCFARLCGYIGSDNAHGSVSSVEPFFQCFGSQFSAEDKLDSGIGKGVENTDTLLVLEHKLDKVSELLQQQQNLLSSTKEEINIFVTSTINKGENSKPQELISSNETRNAEACDKTGEPSAARSLLDAIESKQDVSLDDIVRVALESFLQSDSVKEHVATATAESVKKVVQSSFPRAFSDAYLPLVERSHRRLLAHVNKLLDDFSADLEEGTASWFKSIHKSSRTIRAALDNHQRLLEATDPVGNINLLRAALKSVLEEELRSWRCRVVQELSQEAGGAEPEREPEYSESAPASPMQPANPHSTVIDTLMKCALIKKHIEEGDVCCAFEVALSSADLALVLAACRAVPAHSLRLRPAALLALLQQLATDMVHDTQLKCRYLEETILRLQKCDDDAARQHLPGVARDVRRHLTQFLSAYPNHHASRRIAIILMALDTFH